MVIRLTELGVPLYDEESPAAQQAKQMGLQYKGFGRWANPQTGQITHKTDNQKLVQVDQPAEPSPRRRPRRPRRNKLHRPEVPQEQHKVPVENKPTKEDPSFEELKSSAQKHQYTVLSKSRIKNIRSTPSEEQKIEFKPKGFWFGIQDSWVDWIEGEAPHWKQDNLYSVEVDEDKCLVINTLEELVKFHNTYRTNTSYGEMINWSIVADQYSGVIIKEYFWEKRTDYMWYYTWDVASGCIWDNTAVKSVNQISIT